MSQDTNSLSLAFIDRRPVEAGRVLAAMDPADAAAFLDTVPTRYVARALGHMGAWSACAVMAASRPEVSAAALRRIAYPDAAAILRLTEPDLRARLLALLPHKLRQDFVLSLSYPDDTVGAHMTTAIMTRRPFHTVADARAEVRSARNVDVPVVFVVDENHRVAGYVAPDVLLRHPGKVSLDDVMDPAIEPLLARARIATVADDSAWDAHTYLPVISRQQAVIGALSRQSVAHHRNPIGQSLPAGHAGLAGSLAAALTATIFGLGRLVAGGASKRPPTDTGPEHR